MIFLHSWGIRRLLKSFWTAESIFNCWNKWCALSNQFENMTSLRIKKKSFHFWREYRRAYPKIFCNKNVQIFEGQRLFSLLLRVYVDFLVYNLYNFIISPAGVVGYSFSRKIFQKRIFLETSFIFQRQICEPLILTAQQF